MPEQTDIYISSFPDAESITNADKVTGIQGNANKNFTFSSILAWFVNAVKSAFVPIGRTINGKSLSSDITLTASDVGARPNTWTPSAADVGAIPTTAKGSPLGVAELDSNGQVPSSQLDLSGKQDKITASGILKGDGAGGVSAAVAGTDYGTYSKPSGGIPASDLASGVIPAAYTSNPAMDGTASPGSSGAWAKGDHVHPSDTTKANQAQLATVESGSTASRTYAVGEYFCWNGLLYRVKTAISSGGTFTPGTNCEQTTVMGEAYKNNLSSYTELRGYTSASPFVCPSDGYITVITRNNGFINAYLLGRSGTNAVDLNVAGNGTTTWVSNTTFVRAGMRFYVNSKSSTLSDLTARFYALTD